MGARKIHPELLAEDLAVRAQRLGVHPGERVTVVLEVQVAHVRPSPFGPDITVLWPRSITAADITAPASVQRIEAAMGEG